MPNWCEGTMKVRGSQKKVENFLINGLNRYEYDLQKNESVRLPKDKAVIVDRGERWVEIDIADGTYIEGTRRAFIDMTTVYFDGTEQGEDVCAVLPFRQAWCIDANDYDRLKDKWDVDFRLYGVDCGMGFVQEVIAVRGRETTEHYDDYGGYDNFVWKCPFPRLGG